MFCSLRNKNSRLTRRLHCDYYADEEMNIYFEYNKPLIPTQLIFWNKGGLFILKMIKLRRFSIREDFKRLDICF